MMLINAIESSPNTTPQKTNNRTIYEYPEFLGRQWKFGYESDDGGAEEEDDDMVDVVNLNGHVMMRHHGRLRSTG